jgi:hypothetical protein
MGQVLAKDAERYREVQTRSDTLLQLRVDEPAMA